MKDYIQRGKKNDADDAAAIAEAVSHHFVPVKSEDRQAVLMLHRARHMLVRQHPCLRPHLA